jgi:hypothetical protein
MLVESPGLDDREQAMVALSIKAMTAQVTAVRTLD